MSSGLGMSYGGVVGRVGWPQPAGPAPPPLPPRVTTPWSFKLLLAFVILLFANLQLVAPQLAPLAPVQTVAVGALALLFVERTLNRQRFRLVWPEGHLLLAFLTAASLSTLTALWTRHAVDAAIDLLKLVVIYFLIVNTVESWRRLRITMTVLVAGSLVPALGAVNAYRRGELLEGRAMWIGVFSNPNDLAVTLVVAFPIAAALAIGARGWWRLPGLATVGTLAVAIFLTFSRSGLAGFFLVLLLSSLCWSRGLTRLLLAVAAVGLLVVAVMIFWGRRESFSDPLADATLQQRLSTVEAGIAMVVDRPLLGVGIGGSVIGWPLYAEADDSSEGWLHSHNTFIQVLAETGLLGAVPFFLLLAAGLRKAHRVATSVRRRGHPDLHRLCSALAISLWGFLLSAMAGGYLLSWMPYLVLGLVSAASLLPEPREEER